MSANEHVQLKEIKVTLLLSGGHQQSLFLKPDDPLLHCDFIFVSADLASRIADVRVDRDTQAADHQPVILTLA